MKVPKHVLDTIYAALGAMSASPAGGDFSQEQLDHVNDTYTWINQHLQEARPRKPKKAPIRGPNPWPLKSYVKERIEY